MSCEGKTQHQGLLYRISLEMGWQIMVILRLPRRTGKELKKISRQMSLQAFAVTVAALLKKENIDVILTGGAVVSIYSEG